MDDYHAFHSTTGGGGPVGPGCSSVLIWVAVIIGVLAMIGELAG